MDLQKKIDNKLDRDGSYGMFPISIRNLPVPPFNERGGGGFKHNSAPKRMGCGGGAFYYMRD